MRFRDFVRMREVSSFESISEPSLMLIELKYEPGSPSKSP